MGYGRVWRLAWPLILANSTVPLLGLVDTAVIGHTGRSVDLGAIALGALIFNVLFWGFGFLRMGTTGFAAQADGAGDELEVRAVLGRAVLLAAAIGLGLILLQAPIASATLRLLGASPAVEGITRGYILTRIWGAPASLALYAVMGLLIGLGHSGRLLRVQLLLNGLNMLLDVLFAGLLGWGARGIALGTAVAEWLAVAYAGWITLRLLAGRRRAVGPFWPWRRIVDPARLRQTLAANGDIMLRTLLLLFGFAWFMDRSARFGDGVLAGNHILLQFVSFSAFFLDGFAYATETLVGRAMGAGRRDLLDAAVRTASRLAAGTAAALAMGIVVLGPWAVAALTDLAEVRAAAQRYLPYAAVYVLLAVAAFQLDGIFIGATRTRAMRNASLAAIVAFLAASWPLVEWAGNDGLWAAFIVFVVARALALGAYYPALRRAVGRSS
jgi:MATE family multidrug resistance protein